MKKKLLYVGHNYHLKTKSNSFLIDILKEYYDIFYVTYNPYTDQYDGLEDAQGKHFDVALIYQVLVGQDFVRKNFSFSKLVFVPMYDQIVTAPMENPFSFYRDCKIICFSKTLYNDLGKRGFKAFYLQYFPPVDETHIDEGNPYSVFFWQRMELINLKVVEKLFSKVPIEHFHVHKAMDPGWKFEEPGESIADKITYSQWFESAEDMKKLMEESAYYIAPRLYEGIGMSFLEAMAMGRCVIAPDAPTASEYIQNGVTGILYNPHDVHPIPINEDVLRNIQKNAKEFIRKGRANWEANKDQIIDFIESADTTEKPLVTIVTVVKNIIKEGREAFFNKAISSVRGQDYPNIEHLVIDGASTDITLTLLEKYQHLGWIRYISEPDHGMYEGLNKGIRNAKGKYIAFLNSDDYYCRTDAISKTVEALENTGADFAYASNELVSEDGDVYAVRYPEIGSFVAQMPFCHQTMFCKTSMLREMGGFDERYKSSADYDLVIRSILGGYRYVDVEECIVAYRNGGMSEAQEERSNKEKFDIFVRHFNKFCDHPFNEKDGKTLSGRQCRGDLYKGICTAVPRELAGEITKACVRYDAENDYYIFKTEIIKDLYHSAALENIVPAPANQNAGTALATEQAIRLRKFRSYFFLLESWVRLKQQGKDISSFFSRKGYQNIAIYGFGKIGKLLFNELKDSDIRVTYAIDQFKSQEEAGIRVYGLDEQLPQVDCIVVATDFIFEDIKSKLEPLSSAAIVNVDDIFLSDM